MAVERSMQVRLDMLVGDYIRNASNAAKATEGIAAAAQKPRTALERVGEAAKGVGTMVASVAGVGVTALAAWGVSAFAAGAAFNTLQQTAGSALVTVLGSAEAASAQMEELVTWSKTSPFPRQLWIEAQQILLGFGYEASKIVPTLAAIQDGMVAVGGGEQQIREVVQILAKVNSTGSLTAGTLNELAYRGIDAAALIGAAFGRTAEEIRADVSRGAIDAQTFLDTLTTALQTRFEGAAEGLRTTWVGAVDRIKGATRDVGAIMAEPFIDPAGGGAAVQWANDIADAIRALEAIMRPAMETLRDRAQPAFQAASEAAQRFAAALREVDLIAILDRLSAGAPILLSFGAAAAAAGSSSALAAIGMGGLAATVSPLAAGITTLAVVSPELRSALMDLLGALAPLIPPATELALELAELVSSGAGLAGSILSVLAPALSVLVTAATPLIQIVSGLVGALDAVPGPALAAAAGVLGLVKILAMLRSFTGSLVIAGMLDAAFTKIEGSSKRAGSAVGGLSGSLKGLAAAGVVGIVVGLANALDQTGDQLERVQAVDISGLARDLQHLVNTGAATAALTRLFGDGAGAAEEFVDQMYVASKAWWDWSYGLNRSINENAAAEESFDRLDSAMAQLVESGMNADQVLNAVASAYNLNAEEIEVLLGLLPRYTAEAERQAAAQEAGAGAADEHTDGLEGLEVQAEATRASLKSLADEMRAQVDPVFAAIKATRDLADAQEAYDDAIAEHGSTSEEARGALLDLLEAQAEAASAAGELAEVATELPPEILALAEAADLSADDIAWLEEQFIEAQGAGEDFRDAIADVTADITTATGRMKVANALELGGMKGDWADFVVTAKSMVDDLMASGYSYEEALAEVARRTNKSQALIESGFEDARAAGLEFSDEYPAHIRLTGADEAMDQISSLTRLIHNVPSYKQVQIDYTRTGILPPSGEMPYSRGGRVGGPLGAGDVVPARLTPGEHVWTRSEVDAAGGHAAVEAMRAAVLAGRTRFASAAPARTVVSAGSAVPAHFTATAVIDLGEGVQRVVDIKLERHDRDLKRSALMGTGANR